MILLWILPSRELYENLTNIHLFKVNNGNSSQWLKYDANPCSKSTMETPNNDWNIMQILVQSQQGNSRQWLKYDANLCSKSTMETAGNDWNMMQILVQSQQWKHQTMIEIWCKSLFKVINGNTRQWLKYDAILCSKSTMETPGNNWNMMQILYLHETHKELMKYAQNKNITNGTLSIHKRTIKDCQYFVSLCKSLKSVQHSVKYAKGWVFLSLLQFKYHFV